MLNELQANPTCSPGVRLHGEIRETPYDRNERGQRILKEICRLVDVTKSRDTEEQKLLDRAIRHVLSEEPFPEDFSESFKKVNSRSQALYQDLWLIQTASGSLELQRILHRLGQGLGLFGIMTESVIHEILAYGGAELIDVPNILMCGIATSRMMTSLLHMFGETMSRLFGPRPDRSNPQQLKAYDERLKGCVKELLCFEVVSDSDVFGAIQEGTFDTLSYKDHIPFNKGNLFRNLYVAISQKSQERRSDEDSVQSVDLSKCHFTRVPESLKRLTRLEILYLSKNSITDFDSLKYIPGSVSALVLADCGLREIPQGLERLTGLNRLSLSQNPITDLNSFEHIPGSVSALVLADCGLREIPQGLERLTGLDLLSLLQNPITDLNSFEHIPGSVSWLSLAGCGLREIPQGLERLTRLQKLTISNNPITDFDSLKYIPGSVKELYLEGCGLIGKPKILERLVHLQSLTL